MSADTTAPGELIRARFGDGPEAADVAEGTLLTSMLARGSCRSFEDRAVSSGLLEVICAAALSAPTKSDLQQRDIVLLKDPAKRAALATMVGGQAWVADAPMLAVFCGNNRRQRLLHEWQEVEFANDHLDAFFNPAVDAAIALGAFVTAAEALGLGCCPISAVRNEAQAVSDLIGLPDHVFPVAGLAIGYPKDAPTVSMRLPLGSTIHTDTYSEVGLRERVEDYDQRRGARQPYKVQRSEERFGRSENYGWSEDKARQYSMPERADFGSYVRGKGFRLD